MARNTPKDRAAAASALARIADFLDVPIAAFYEGPGPDGGAPADAAQRAEIRELVRQFQRLQAPQARRRCLAYVRRVADEASRPDMQPPAAAEGSAPEAKRS